MKKPWQIWTLYALTLLVVVPAMVWLSLQSLQLENAREQDRVETELARREAELQERVSSALWRMDGFLTHLIARETTRPWYLYKPFYKVATFESNVPFAEGPQSAGSGYHMPSPLLFQSSDFVKLHFEIDHNNVVTSPQIPYGDDRDRAFAHGMTDQLLKQNRSQLREIKIMSDFHSMIADCSQSLLPEPLFNDLTTAPTATYDPSRRERDQQFAIDAPIVLPPAGEGDPSLLDRIQRSLKPEVYRFRKYLEETKPRVNGLGGKDQKLTNQSKPQSKQQTTKKQQAQQTRNSLRGATEYSQRQQNVDNFAKSQWAFNQIQPMAGPDAMATRPIREGIMQPIWIQDPFGIQSPQLILVRRVVKANEQVIQGCWLDWNEIQAKLADLVSDLIPELNFRAVKDEDQVRLGQVLATLPVQLVIDRPRLIEKLELSVNSADRSLEKKLSRTGISTTLWIAWSGLIFAAIAGAFLLNGVIRLNERRGAFVSAVSHELRTPLTTFRMYAEMLAEKMVPAEKQQKYAETLKVESERLWHLVENVLQFARLERNNQKSRLEEATLSDILERFEDRLHRRAVHAGMKLVIDLPEEVLSQPMKTDPGAIEQILFNLVDNACKYARDAEDRRIEVAGCLLPTGKMKLSVRDYGPGVDKKDRQRMFLAFRKSDMLAANTAQGVGLGLALCRRMAKSLGGKLDLVDLDDDQTGAKLVLEIPVRS